MATLSATEGFYNPLTPSILQVPVLSARRRLSLSFSVLAAFLLLYNGYLLFWVRFLRFLFCGICWSRYEWCWVKFHDTWLLMLHYPFPDILLLVALLILHYIACFSYVIYPLLLILAYTRIYSKFIGGLYREALLTVEELAAILNRSTATISKRIQEYHQEHDDVLPLKGYVLDIGRGTIHKKQILELYEQKVAPLIFPDKPAIR